MLYKIQHVLLMKIVVVIYVQLQVIVFQIQEILNMTITMKKVVYMKEDLIGWVILMVYIFTIQQVTLNGVYLYH
ncbi:MAG: hypothetical protein EBU84_17935 [Actinobacteria bacterium]|nr:hypothetical protein [Actinomycetota bacterium]